MKRIFQQSKTALGSAVLLTIVANEPPAAIFSGLWQMIYEFDSAYSRFRLDSQVTYLNNAAGQPIDVSEDFERLLAATQAMAMQTDGLFNPFILPALETAGYKQSWAPNPATINPPDYSEREVVGPDNIKLNDHQVLIPNNTAVDLGGIGKGYLLERLAEYLRAVRIKDYWLSLGGDILAQGSDHNDEPWAITIARATDPGQVLATVTILKGEAWAVATSGVTKRQGKGWHHIIDPGTGLPAKTDILTATVCLPSAVEADVYASCLVGLGTIGYRDFMKKHDIEDVMIQTNQGNIKHGQRIKLV